MIRVALPLLVLLAAGALAPAAAQAEGGMGRTCVVKTDHTVWCWGSNSSGMLGSALLASAVPVQISSIDDAVAVTGSGSFSCILRTDSTVECWGDNSSGQLGDGTTNSSNTPVTVQGLDDVEQLASGFSSSCAVSATGTVACWGQNYNGQLGNGSTTSSPVPVDVAGITTAVSVSIKDSHACALLADTTVKCWGRNGEGQLGDGTTTDSLLQWPSATFRALRRSPRASREPARFSATAPCAGWGSNPFAFLGGGSTDPYSTVPVTVPGIGTAVEVSSGYQICVRLANHSVICWGIIDADAYSAAATTEGGGGSAPALVPGITDAAALTEGMFSQCAVQLNHKVACWGLAMMGGLGNGHSPILTSPDLPAQGLTDATAVASGSLFSCALRATKAVMCWGVGPFGDGATSQYKASFVPSSVPGATDITAFDVGSEHGCAVITGGAVKCLGRNDYGQLGDGSTDDSYLAMLNVSGISDASSVATGRSHSCALRAGGTVACWGHNGDRQLGDGTTDNSANPVTVDGVSNATQIAAGRDFNLRPHRRRHRLLLGLWLVRPKRSHRHQHRYAGHGRPRLCVCAACRPHRRLLGW